MPKPTKLPRARVRKISLDSLGTLFLDFNPSEFKRGSIVVVSPINDADRKKAARFARQRAKWENLSEGEKVERLAKKLSALYPQKRHNSEKGFFNIPWEELEDGHGSSRAEYRFAAREVLAALAVMEGRTL